MPTGPLTFEAALDLATSRNLGLLAARRQREIREAAIVRELTWQHTRARQELQADIKELLGLL